METLQDTILPALGTHFISYFYHPIIALHIVGPGASFGSNNLQKEVSETEKPFATMLIQLPSIFSGGDSIVSYEGMPRLFSTSKRGSEGLSYMAFYSNCTYTQKEIISGYRAVMEVSLAINSEEPTPSPYLKASRCTKLSFLINKFFDIRRSHPKSNGRLDGKMICFSHDVTRTTTPKCPSTVTEIPEILSNALDYDKVHDRSTNLILYTATVRKYVSVNSESGNSWYSLAEFKLITHTCDSDEPLETKNLVLLPQKHVIRLEEFDKQDSWVQVVEERTGTRLVFRKEVLLLVSKEATELPTIGKLDGS